MPEPSGLSRVPEGGLRRLSIPSAFCRSSSTICQSVLPWHCWRCSIRRDGRVVDCTGLENHLSSSLRVTYLGMDASQDALLSIKTKLYLSIFCQQPRAEITDSSYATVVPDGSMVSSCSTVAIFLQMGLIRRHNSSCLALWRAKHYAAFRPGYSRLKGGRSALGPTKQTLVLDSSIRMTPSWANFTSWSGKGGRQRPFHREAYGSPAKGVKMNNAVMRYLSLCELFGIEFCALFGIIGTYSRTRHGRTGIARSIRSRNHSRAFSNHSALFRAGQFVKHQRGGPERA